MNKASEVIATLVFYILNILLFPVSLLGYVIHVACLLTAGRASGVSTSAQSQLSVRWTQHYLGVRQDEAACQLMNALLGSFPLGWYLVAGPTLLAHRVTVMCRWPSDTPSRAKSQCRI